jgi:hypothetical protein
VTRGMRGTDARGAFGMLLMLTLCMLSGCWGQGLAVPGDDEWVRTQDDTTQISVELPGTAQMQNQAVPLPTGESLSARMWTVEIGEDAAVSFAVTDFQGQPIDLPGALQGMAANIGGRIEESSEVSQAGRNAMDGTISFTQQDTDGTVYARVVDAGDSMVLLQSVGRSSTAATLADLQQRMVDSLTLPQ